MLVALGHIFVWKKSRPHTLAVYFALVATLCKDNTPTAENRAIDYYKESQASQISC